MRFEPDSNRVRMELESGSNHCRSMANGFRYPVCGAKVLKNKKIKANFLTLWSPGFGKNFPDCDEALALVSQFVVPGFWKKLSGLR